MLFAELDRLQEEVRQAEAPLVARMQKALKLCRSADAITKCVVAYGFLIESERDRVMQRHGYPAKLFPNNAR